MPETPTARTKDPSYYVFRKEGTGADLNAGSTWKLLNAAPVRASSRKEAIRKATEVHAPVSTGTTVITTRETGEPSDGVFLVLLAGQVPTPITRKTETKQVEIFS